MIDDFNTHVNYAGLNADATQPDDGDDDSQLYKMDILNVNEVVCLTDDRLIHDPEDKYRLLFLIPSFHHDGRHQPFQKKMSGIFYCVGC
jgi:hypothetical protein